MRLEAGLKTKRTKINSYFLIHKTYEKHQYFPTSQKYIFNYSTRSLLFVATIYIYYNYVLRIVKTENRTQNVFEFSNNPKPIFLHVTYRENNEKYTK